MTPKTFSRRRRAGSCARASESRGPTASRTFASLLGFVDRVGALAEDEGHHPDITFGWGYATVSLHTHKIKGLHENDFIMAAKINGLAPAAT